MIYTSNINQAKDQIRKSSAPIVVKSHDLQFNRKMLDYGKFDVLLALDKPLNHVMARLATKHKVTIALDIFTLTKLGKKEKAKKLEQIRQNIKSLRKAKTKLSIINAKDKKDAKFLLISLGASTKQTL
jgi:RNase P/RNase MRP subunit p30